MSARKIHWFTSPSTTSEHPFWVDGKGFVEAQKLSAGDMVLTADDELKTITAVTIEKLTTPVTVYNFEVKDWHTYYVSEEEILVHNECGGGKYQVGLYKDIKVVEGMDRHHVGQKALMKKLVKNYDSDKAPAINVPKEGHTILGPKGIVSRSTKNINNARQLLARDLFELKRVYSDIPRSAYRELIDLNQSMYPEMRKLK